MPLEKSRMVMKFMLSVAKGDGVASPQEVTWLKRLHLAAGMDLKLIEEIYASAFNEKDEIDREALIMEMREDPDLHKLCRILIYQAIECAASDGFDSLEKAAAEQFALGFGLSKEEFDAILEIYEENFKLKLKRIKVLKLENHPLLDPRLKAAISDN